VSLAGIWIGTLALVYRLALVGIVGAALDVALSVRLLVVAALTAAIGAPMGVPFPSLLRIAGAERQRVALLWAVNGIFSVVGSALAVALSMTWGFSRALTLGAVSYLLLAALALGLWRLGS
jgi:hypothetical protein